MNFAHFMTNLSQKNTGSILTSSLRKSIDQTPLILRIIFKLFFRRKRFSMQLLKSFILFPESSSALSVESDINQYDRLIFSDEALHTMVKIMQTKQIENMIWAFINLKSLKYLENVVTLKDKITRVTNRVVSKNKQSAFDQIKLYSIKVHPHKKQTITHHGNLTIQIKNMSKPPKSKLSKNSNVVNLIVKNTSSRDQILTSDLIGVRTKSLHHRTIITDASENNSISSRILIKTSSITPINSRSNALSSYSRQKNQLPNIKFNYLNSESTVNDNMSEYSVHSKKRVKLPGDSKQYRYLILNEEQKMKECCNCCIPLASCDKNH